MGKDEIKKNLKSGKLVLGRDRVLKLLKLGKLTKIYLASNSPASITKDIDYYTTLNKTQVEVLDLPNDELGTLCRKTYSVSVIGLER